MLTDLQDIPPQRFRTPEIFEYLTEAARALAELKGSVSRIPNHAILISTLPLREAKESSAIEQIVTTYDELYQQQALPDLFSNPAAKEVARYQKALNHGFRSLKSHNLLTIRQLEEIQQILIGNDAGLRTQAGTVIKNQSGETVYEPPQNPSDLRRHLAQLERIINDPQAYPADPLVKMALIHYQFEAIHPFYDGNGRTGRILNVLYLVQQNLLTIPVLYLSGAILQTREQYYQGLRAVQATDNYEQWVIYMLRAVTNSAQNDIRLIGQIADAFSKLKNAIRDRFKFYSQDLLNHLFAYPYCTVQSLQKALSLKQRNTAAKYLDQLAEAGFLRKHKVGRTNLFINQTLFSILVQQPEFPPHKS